MGFIRWQWYYNKAQHTTLKQNTAHKITQTIRDTLHTMNTMKIHLQLQYSHYNYFIAPSSLDTLNNVPSEWETTTVISTWSTAAEYALKSRKFPSGPIVTGHIVLILLHPARAHLTSQSDHFNKLPDTRDPTDCITYNPDRLGAHQANGYRG
jgi:hypothetical protein